MLCRKIENGFETSDIATAAALMCAGAKYGGIGYAKPLSVPGVALIGKDGKEVTETDFDKATAMIHDMEFRLSGIYLPRERGYKVFKLLGDPDKLHKNTLKFHNGELAVDARDFSQQHRNLLSLIKDHT